MKLSLTAALVAVVASAGICQPPDLIWYDFNTADATNTATPGVGNGTPNASLFFGAGGPLCAGDGDVSPPAQASTSTINTGWPTTLGSGDWSIGAHLDLTAGGGFVNYFQYCWGDSTAGAFRMFIDGAAGNGNAVLRGPLTQAIITGGGSQTAPVHVCWVYDSSVPEIRGYLNGVLNVAVPQAPLTINGSANFTVLNYPGAASSSMRPGTRMDDFRLYGRAIDIGGVGPGSELGGWAGSCAGGAVVPTTFQVNQPNAHFDINGAPGNGFASARSTVCTSDPSTLTLEGAAAPGLPYDLGIWTGPAIADTSGGTPAGQLVNLDVLSSLPGGGPYWLSTGAQAFPPPPGFVWNGVPLVLGFNAPPIATLAHAQGYWIDPTSIDFVSLSAPGELETVAGSSQNLTLMDDNFVEVGFSLPLCAPFSSFAFAGTSYNSIFVNSNGSVGFGAGEADFNATVLEFQNGSPRVAGMWSDLSPNIAGTVTVTSSSPDLVVSFMGVPEFGTAANVNSFDVKFDTAGATTIENYVPSPAHATATLVGLTPGGGATDPTGGTGISFDGVPLGMPQAGVATDMVYEFNPAGAVSNMNWTSIVFPNSDGSLYIVN